MRIQWIQITQENDRNQSCPYLRQEALKKTVGAKIGAKNERIATISSLTTQDNKLGI